MENILNLVSENMNLILLGGMGVYFILFFIFGFNGLKKAIFRLITSVIFIVGLVFLLDPLTNFAFNFDISFALGSVSLPLNMSGNTVNELIDSLVTQYAAGEAAGSAAALVASLIGVVFKLVLVLVISLVLFGIYWFLTQIIWWIFFKHKKRDKAKGKKKHAFFGALLHGAKGCLIYLFTALVLINGPLAMLPKMSEFEKENSEGEVENALNAALGSDKFQPIFDILNSYQTSFFYTLFNGNQEDAEAFSLDKFVNGKIYTIKVGEESMDIRTEIRGILSLSTDLLTVYEGVKDKENINIDYPALANVLYALNDSQLLNALLPLGTQIAVNIDAVKDKLPEGVGEKLSEVVWTDTFKSFGDIALQIGNLSEKLNYIEVEANNKLMKIDFDSIDSESVSEIFEALSNISLITTMMDVAVEYALGLESVQAKIGELELEVNDLVWKDEIVNIGNIINKLFDVGFDCLNSVTHLKTGLDMIDFGDPSIEDDHGGIGNLIDAIFASKFVDSLFPQIMEKTVMKMIRDKKPEYADLFDFEAVNEKGWPNEMNDLIAIFKDAKSGEDPFFGEDGKLNFDIIEKIRPKTLLKSVVLPNALINMFVQAKEGKGILASAKDTILIPDELGDATSENWKQTTLDYYVVQEDFVENNITYKKYAKVKIADYSAMSSDNQAKMKPQNKIVGGEIYYIINALDSVTDVLSIKDAMNGNIKLELSNVLLNKLIKEKEGKSVIKSLSDSMILRTTLSSFINEASDLIIIPTLAFDEVHVNEEKSFAIKGEELENVIKGIAKLEIVSDTYIVKEEFEADGRLYEVGNIYKGIYEKLSKENQAKLDITSEVEIGISLVEKLEQYDYKCIEAFENYKVGEIISHSTYESIDVSNKDKFVKNYMTIDYLVGSEDEVIDGSEILIATISDYIVGQKDDSNTSILVVPEGGEDGCIAEGYQNQEGEDIKVIKKEELRRMVKTINVLGVVKVVYYALEDVTLDGIPYTRDQMISKQEYEAITDGNKVMFFEQDADLNVSISLISTFNDEVEDGYTKVDYVVGDKGSKIMHATISNIILGNADRDEDSLVIPYDDIELLADKNVITTEEFRALITAINALDITKEYHCNVTVEGLYNVGDNISKTEYEKLTPEQKSCFVYMSNPKIEADVNIISSLLYLDGEDRKVDKVLGSHTLNATLSKYVLENSSSIVIPSSAKVAFDKYYIDDISTSHVQPTLTYMIANAELRELLVSLCELELIQDGNINASLSIVKKIDGNYQYKPGLETTSETPEYDTLEVIDHINNSLIMRATISEKIFDQSSTINIIEPTFTVIDSEQVFTAVELKNFIKAINALNIINDDNTMKDLDSITSTILNDSDAQEAIGKSLVLRATLSNKIATTLQIPLDGADFNYLGDVITTSQYLELASNQKGYVTYRFADINSNNIILISEEELASLFDSLSLLGISSFSTVDVNFATIKTLQADGTLIDLFNSRIIWQKTSDSVLNSTDGASDTKLFTVPAYDTDSITVRQKGSTVISHSMYQYGLTTLEQVGYEEVINHAYDRDILFADTYKRLAKTEVVSLVDLLVLLGGSGNDFKPDADVLKAIYSDPSKSAEFAEIMTSSVLLSKSVSSVFTTIIDNAISGTMFASAGDAIKQNIINLAALDEGLWRDYHSTIGDFEVDGTFGYADNELGRLLGALNALTAIHSVTDINVTLAAALDNSFCIRPLLGSLNVIGYYEVTTPYNGVAGTYVIGDIISYTNYAIAIALDSGIASCVNKVEYNANDTQANRTSIINNAFAM